MATDAEDGELHWTELAGYTDRSPAEVLAQFLADDEIPSRILEPQSMGPPSYLVLVPERRADEIRRRLDWVSVAEYEDVISAEVAAGRLTGENIPSTLGSPGVRAPLPLSVFVPMRLKTAAERILSESPASDQELTELALRPRPPDDA